MREQELMVSQEYLDKIKELENKWEESSNHKKLEDMWDEELLISRKRRLKKESGVHVYRLRELGV